jgi:hypothetical protein
MRPKRLAAESAFPIRRPVFSPFPFDAMPTAIDAISEARLSVFAPLPAFLINKFCGELLSETPLTRHKDRRTGMTTKKKRRTHTDCGCGLVPLKRLRGSPSTARRTPEVLAKHVLASTTAATKAPTLRCETCTQNFPHEDVSEPSTTPSDTIPACAPQSRCLAALSGTRSRRSEGWRCSDTE